MNARPAAIVSFLLATALLWYALVSGDTLSLVVALGGMVAAALWSVDDP